MLPATLNGSTPATRPVNRLESLFDRVFGDDFGFPMPSWNAVGPAWGFAPVSVWEDDDHLYIEMEVPGVAEQDVDITVLKGQLIVRGERKAEEGRRYLYNGRPFGRFERVLTLPEAIDAENAQAAIEHGVLHIVCAKRPESRPKKIALTSRTN